VVSCHFRFNCVLRDDNDRVSTLNYQKKKKDDEKEQLKNVSWDSFTKRQDHPPSFSFPCPTKRRSFLIFKQEKREKEGKGHGG
jgi:hypothetical protein